MTTGTRFAIAAPAEARPAIVAALSRAGWQAAAHRRNMVIAEAPAPLDEHDLLEFTFAMGAFGATQAFARDNLSITSAAA
jgi:hypothetical protein